MSSPVVGMTAETALSLDMLARGIEDDIVEADGRRIERRRRDHLSGYDIGDPCSRYLAYTLTNWQDQALPSAEKQALFELGAVFAEDMQRRLRVAEYEGVRYRVEAQEVAWEVRTRSGRPITGHLDFWLTGGRLGDRRVPIEAKGLSYGQEDRWATWRDMRKAAARWVKRYPDQLAMYLLQSSSPLGFFAIESKESGRITLLPMELDMEHGESLLQKAEDIYLHVECGELPPRIPYDHALCGQCDFAHICVPEKEIEVGAAGLVLDPVKEAQVARYFELQPLAKEFEQIGEVLKGFAKAAAVGTGLSEFVVGGATLEVQERDRKGYTVGATHYQQVKISERGR